METEFWTLTDCIEFEEGQSERTGTPPPGLSSKDWFNPREKANENIPCTLALAKAWEVHMRYLDHNEYGWGTRLEGLFGQRITPEEASSLMSVFIHFGTNVGYGYLYESFKEYSAPLTFHTEALPIFGYWTSIFFSTYAVQQGYSSRLKATMSSNFQINHFTLFIRLIEYLMNEEGSKFLNEALIQGGRNPVINPKW